MDENPNHIRTPACSVLILLYKVMHLHLDTLIVVLSCSPFALRHLYLHLTPQIADTTVTHNKYKTKKKKKKKQKQTLDIKLSVAQYWTPPTHIRNLVPTLDVLHAYNLYGPNVDISESTSKVSPRYNEGNPKL